MAASLHTKNSPANTPREIPRAPIVVIMGHIDHGKSTLLDYIRKSNVVAGEAGGITQHLGAYEVAHTSKEGKKGSITFLDTPGHEAFCDIRARGTKVADIAILVVSAEDGVKPQTLEALACIREEKIPFIVAINKIDKQGADAERTKLTLAEAEVYVEGYGGDTPVVPISALKGTGVPDLLDMIMLVAELEDLKACADVPASGIVIEANLDTKKGISATIIITEGTLSSGNYIVAENAFAPVRILEDFQGKPIKSATLSNAVKVIGWNTLPPVGAAVITVADKKEAELKAREAEQAHVALQSHKKDESFEGKVVIPVIIKADVTGSLEGIHHELKKLSHDKVAIKIVNEGIGDISEADLKVAQGDPRTIVINFNTKIDTKARAVIERGALQVKSFSIIYDLIAFLKETVTAQIPKEYSDQMTGRAKILQIFSKNKDKQIVGGKVQEGSITLGAEVKILRRDAEIGRGRIKELQQQKAKASEVREGYEFGTLIESKIEIAQGDKIEGFITVEK